MVLKDELIMLFQFYFNDFCRFRKRKGKDRRRRGKRAEGRRQKAEGRRQKAEGRRQKAEGRRQKAEGRRQLVYTPSKTDSPQEGAIRWKNIGSCPMLSEIFF